jgi:hypothetical protein
MRADPTPNSSPQDSRSSGTIWIAPACGLLSSLFVTWIGRTVDFEYRRELSMAAFFVVSIMVSGYYNGSLKTRPAVVVGLAIVFAAVAAAIMHW